MLILSRRWLWCCLFLVSATLHAEDIFGLTSGNKLVRFDSASPGTIISTLNITGLQASESILAIDFRPVTGQLIGLGSTSRVYRIDITTGAATSLATPNNPFVPALNGAAIGMDFNPIVDRIRVVTDMAQNLRLNPNTGTTAATDTALAYAPLDVNFGTAPKVVSVAYTDNTANQPSNAVTTLYGIDSKQGTLVTIGTVDGGISPNGGQCYTVGKLGVSFLDMVGFDISGQTQTAYASLIPAGETAAKLYSINVSTGTATLIGKIGGSDTIVDIAVVSAVLPFDVVGLVASNATLVRFDSRTPQNMTVSIPVTGLAGGGGEFLQQLDYRPSNGKLYGLSNVFKLYTVDPVTAVATLVGGPLAPAPTSSNAGFNFNPVVDLIRFVNVNDQNLRIDPATGLVAGTDTNVAYDATDANAANDAGIAAVAYTNNVAGATSTTLYGIDLTNARLVTINPPNGGNVFTVGAGSLGVTPSAGVAIGFDIAPNGNAYAAITIGGVGGFYSVNLTTGTVTQIGNNLPNALRSIAVITNTAAQTVQFSVATDTVIEGNSATLTVTRTGSTAGTASVDYDISAGTATAGSDFNAAKGTLTFLNGEASRTISVPALTDNTLELYETVIATLSNPVGCSLGTQTTLVLSIADKDDIDGDGFINTLETVAGTDPASAASTPFNGAPVGTAQPLTLTALGVKLNFAKPASDSISFAGTLPLPDSFAPSGQKVQLNINSVTGVVKSFTLDVKGRTPKGNDAFALAKPKGGVAKFGVKLNKGDFAAQLKSAGFSGDASVKSVPLTLQVDVFINNADYQAMVPVLYSASQGKSGGAKIDKKK